MLVFDSPVAALTCGSRRKEISFVSFATAPACGLAPMELRYVEVPILPPLLLQRSEHHASNLDVLSLCVQCFLSIVCDSKVMELPPERQKVTRA